MDEIIKQIKRIQKRYPTMRVGQIVENAIGSLNLFYVEDDKLAKAIEELANYYERE